VDVTSLFNRRRLAVFGAILFTAGCGSQQGPSLPLPPASQNVAALGVQPAAACPVVGKTYTRSDGRGQASMKFQEAWTKAGPYESYLRTKLVYTNWPQNRPLIYKKLTMSTCGQESGKPPIGQIREGSGSTKIECRDNVCSVTLDFDVVYQPPTKLPGGKRWKFDFVRFAPDKPTKGFDPLPIYRIVVSR